MTGRGNRGILYACFSIKKVIRDVNGLQNWNNRASNSNKITWFTIFWTIFVCARNTWMNLHFLNTAQGDWKRKEESSIWWWQYQLVICVNLFGALLISTHSSFLDPIFFRRNKFGKTVLHKKLPRTHTPKSNPITHTDFQLGKQKVPSKALWQAYFMLKILETT